MKLLLTAILSLSTLASASMPAISQSPAAAPAVQVTPPAAPVAAAPPTAATSAETPEIRTLQKVEDSWTLSLNNRDQYGLELVLSPLFVNVSDTGDVTTRNQQVVALINQEDKTASTEFRVVTVRMLGDVAVASGTYTYTHKAAGGPIQDKGIFTHVFQRQHGNWVCLNAQRTLLREQTPDKAKSKAKSDTGLPFHIPLFSKDKSDSSPASQSSKQQ